MRCVLYCRPKNKTSQTTQANLLTNLSSYPLKPNLGAMGRQTRNSRNTPDTKHGPLTRQTRNSQQSNTTTIPSSRSTVAMVNKTSVKPAANETGQHRPSGGRHLQPPTGNDAKLKHKCPFEGCPWRFATPYKLRRHIKSHTKETPYQCKDCGRGFSVRYNLLMHIQTIHSTPQKYRCPVRGCKDAFHTQPRLNGHLRKVHKTDLKQLQAEKDKDSSSTTASPEDQSTSHTTLSCQECNKEFATQAKLTAHLKTHTTSKPHRCKFEGCYRSFQTLDKLNKHMETHASSKTWLCPFNGCKRHFLRQSYLKNHLKAHTKMMKDNKLCPVQGCGHKFSSEVDYNDHINLHMGYSLPCPQCSLVFPTPKRLELHCHVAHANKEDITGFLPQQNGISLVTPTTPTTPVSCVSEDQQTLSSIPVNKETSTITISQEHEESSIHKLPDLKIEDVEAVCQHNVTNEQVFLRPLTFNEEYESDSGYSTFDVSPHGSSSSNYFANLLSPSLTPTPMQLSPAHFGYPDIDGSMGNPAGFFSFPPLSANSGSSSCSNESPFFFGSSGQTADLPRTPSEGHTSFLPPISLPRAQVAHETVLNKCGEATPTYCMGSGTIQTAQQATNDIFNLEESKHTVVVVPNTHSYSTAHFPFSANEFTRDKVATTPIINSKSPISVAMMTTPPPLRVEESIVVEIKPEISTMEQRRSSSSDGHVVDQSQYLLNSFGQEPIDNGKLSSISYEQNPLGIQDSGRTVYAQVLASSGKPASVATNNKNAKKMRQRSLQSKQTQRKGSTSKSQWPKSMNPGNLVAFRNFILKKLNKDKETDEDESMALYHSDPHHKSDSLSLPPEHICYGDDNSIIDDSHLVLLPPDFQGLDNIFDDIDFNPDSLLAPECSQSTTSPFSVSTNGSPDPFSPSGTESVHERASMSPLAEDYMDFNGFFHFFDVDPSSSDIDLPLSHDLDMIFKSDADPLLGGIS